MILDRLFESKINEEISGYDRSSDFGFIPAKSESPIYGEELIAYVKKRLEQARNKFTDNRGKYKDDATNIDLWDLRLQALKEPKVTEGDFAALYDDEGNEVEKFKVFKNAVGALFITVPGSGKSISQWVGLDIDDDIVCKVEGTMDNPRVAWYDEEEDRWHNVAVNKLMDKYDAELTMEPMEEFKARVKKNTGYNLEINDSKLFRWYVKSKDKVIPKNVRNNYVTGEQY